MNTGRIRHCTIELKIIQLDLEKIVSKIEENNSAIKEILSNNEMLEQAEAIKELIDFNRFLLQKQKEKIGEKRRVENRLNNMLKEENQVEFQMIEDEKRMEILILTFENSIAFNSAHPYFSDKSFIRDLLNEYLKREDYENCARIKKRLDEISLINV
jgi:hypothetical protein